MSQVNVTTTSPPVTGVCSSVLTTTTANMMASSSMELAIASCQYDVVLLPPLIPRDTIRSAVSLATVLQQQSESLIASQA